MSTPNPDVVKQNGLVLANATLLTRMVIAGIGEKNIALSIQGESISGQRIEQMAAMKFSAAISKAASAPNPV